jgi:hypothetical protein
MFVCQSPLSSVHPPTVAIISTYAKISTAEAISSSYMLISIHERTALEDHFHGHIPTYTNMRVHTYVRTRMCACELHGIRAHVTHVLSSSENSWKQEMHKYTHTCTRAYINTFIHVHTCVSTYVYAIHYTQKQDMFEAYPKYICE